MKRRILQILGVAAIATIGMVSCDTDACKDVDCGLYGTCLEGDCVCDAGFGGVNCATDYCAVLTCDATGGVKTAVDDACDCVCNAGYEGADCATLERAKFIGSYLVSDNCSGSGISTYTISVDPASAVTTVLISNFWNEFVNNVTATVSGNTITIANQAPDSDGFTVSGTGTYANGILILNYTVSDGTNSDVCQATMVKQ